MALRRIDRVSSAGFDPLRLKRITDCIRLAALEKKIFHTQITQIGGCAAITSNLMTAFHKYGNAFHPLGWRISASGNFTSQYAAIFTEQNT